LAETEDWIVLPTIGPIVAGQVMLVSRSHRRSVAASSVSGLAEAKVLIAQISAKLHHDFQSDVIIFEHGDGRLANRANPSCIDHAHLQFAPLHRGFVGYAHAALSGWLTLESVGGAWETAGDKPYLLLGAPSYNEDAYVNINPDVMQRQILRQLLATFAGVEQLWNWRLSKDSRLFDITIERWKAGRPLSS